MSSLPTAGLQGPMLLFANRVNDNEPVWSSSTPLAAYSTRDELPLADAFDRRPVLVDNVSGSPALAVSRNGQWLYVPLSLLP
jgi:hypothetical protein